MLNVVLQSDIMLKVNKLSSIILSAIKLNVVMLRVTVALIFVRWARVYPSAAPTGAPLKGYAGNYKCPSLLYFSIINVRIQ
jgi:hypothetical protein